MSNHVRYSSSNLNAEKALDFPWEYPIPRTAFWNDLQFVVGRNFLQNYPTDEIHDLPIDPENTKPKGEKLKLLEELLLQRLATKDAAAAPQTYYDVDYAGWSQLWLGIVTMRQQLGRLDDVEETLRMLISRRQDRTNLSLEHQLGGILIAREQWSEAEEMEKRVLKWLEGKLGGDSPQALSARRMIITAIWKQGRDRREEAERWVAETDDVVEGMGGGRYAVYQESEKELLRKLKGEREASA